MNERAWQSKPDYDGRLQTAQLLCASVMQLLCASRQSLQMPQNYPAADAEPVEAGAWRHWVNCLLTDSSEVRFDSMWAATPDDDGESSGLRTIQEIEVQQTADDECSRCLEKELDDGLQDTRRCFLWLVYDSDRSSYKTGLLYSLDSGRWVQFVTHKATDLLLDTRAGEFNPHGQHLAFWLCKLLTELRDTLLLTDDGLAY